MRSGEREIRRRLTGLPDVLANRRADECLAAPNEDELPSRLEVAVLVEDAVVGQELLAVDGLDRAVRAHRARIEEVAVEMGRADEGRDPARLYGDLLERPGGSAQETGAEEEVLGRVAGHGQLGKEDEIRTRPTGSGEPLE